MATRVAIGTGAFLTAGTWEIADATGTLLSTNTGSTALTTGNLDSAAFMPGAITVAGVAVRLSARAAGSPTNTITITLRKTTAPAGDAAAVTANVSDLPACTAGASSEGGWHYFKFSAPVLLAAGANYVVRATLSATSTAVSLSTNGTANNWQHILVTSTTGAPAAGDDLFLAQILDGATNPATVTAITVTMDSTANTDYGSAVVSAYQTSLAISKACTFAYGVAGATNYILRQSGSVGVYSGGVFNIGTVGGEIPRDSTAVLEFDCAADGQFGLSVWNGGTFTAQGLSRTNLKNIVSCKLNTDEAIGQTTLGVDTDTGWKSGDEVVIATTTTTGTQSESKILNGDAGASSIDITVALAAAHSGTTPTQAEVILLTFPIKLRAVTSTLMSYMSFKATSTVDMDWVEVRYMGTQFTPVALDISTTTGSFDFRYGAIKDGEASPITTAVDANNFSFQDINIYNCATATNCQGIVIAVTTGTAWTLARIVSIAGGNSGGFHFDLQDIGGTVSNLTAVGGAQFAGVAIREALLTSWSISGIDCHSIPNGPGIYFFAGATNGAPTYNGSISNFNLWRNGTTNYGGIYVIGHTSNISTPVNNMTFTTGKVFGNAGAGVMVRPGTATCAKWTFNSVDFAGDSSAGQARGINIDSNNLGPMTIPDWLFINCTFGVASGIMVAHSTCDIESKLGLNYVTMTLINCILASTVEVATTSNANMAPGSYILSQQHDQSVADKGWSLPGNQAYETTTVDVSPSQKLTPLSASLKLESGFGIRGRGFLVPVLSGASVTVSVKVQKDGSYAGAAPRLVLKANPAIGINADEVIDSLSVGSGSWETLTGTTVATASADGVMEFVVDCDGTAGNIFVDTWSCIGADLGGVKYWVNGLPLVIASGSAPGAGASASVFMG